MPTPLATITGTPPESCTLLARVGALPTAPVFAAYGPQSGTRTHTAHVLRVVTPAVGLPGVDGVDEWIRTITAELLELVTPAVGLRPQKWCPRRDSNPHCLRSKRSDSCRWSTRARVKNGGKAWSCTTLALWPSGYSRRRELSLRPSHLVRQVGVAPTKSFGFKPKSFAYLLTAALYSRCQTSVGYVTRGSLLIFLYSTGPGFGQ